MSTASIRIWTFATIFVMIIVVALGWFLGASPKLADAARFDAERRSVEAQNEVARATIAALQADFEQIDELREELDALRDEFPTDAEYDSAIEELLTGLLSRGLILQNIAINEPAPTTAATLEEGVEPPEPEVDGDGILPTGSLLRITVSVTVTGPLTSVLSYIDALQQSPRFSIIPSGDFNSGASETGGATTFQLIMYAVTGDDLPEFEPTEPEPEPSATPEPTDSASPGAVDPSATPSPAPTP